MGVSFGLGSRPVINCGDVRGLMIMRALAASGNGTSLLTTLANMDLAWNGEPFVWGAVSSSTDLGLMDLAWNGQPFVADSIGI